MTIPDIHTDRETDRDCDEDGKGSWAIIITMYCMYYGHVRVILVDLQDPIGVGRVTDLDLAL